MDGDVLLAELRESDGVSELCAAERKMMSHLSLNLGGCLLQLLDIGLNGFRDVGGLIRTITSANHFCS